MGSSSVATAAADFATACARRGLGIVYGGGSAGLMGILADTALAAGGEVIGVIPKAMIALERAHHRLTQLRRTGASLDQPTVDFR
jgi:predicted Rossmann-fold nucleotide-binding protein